MEWHSRSAAAVMDELKVSPSRGLDEREAANRLEEYGSNVLRKEKKKSLILVFFEQFSDFMVLILLGAAAVSFIISVLNGDADFVDPIIILAIVIVNAIIGVSHESRAGAAIEALMKMTAPETTVIRGGRKIRIAAAEVVPGDILSLESGDLVPADARLISDSSLKAEESSLTGESLPSEKSASVILPENLPIGERKNMLFAASVITSGHGIAVVTATGMNTQVGHIAGMLNSGEEPMTPLQNRLANTGKVLGIGALAICALIFLLGIFQQRNPLEMFLISVSLAVAAIPEGLPAIVTIVLAAGVSAMAGKNAIIRKLPAVETLGSATVICSDKTGTLTQNKMSVTEIRGMSGTLNKSGGEAAAILSLTALCNNSSISQESGGYSGDPTETALITAAADAGINRKTLTDSFPRVDELPFESSRKLMSTLHRKDGGYRVITKGAPDVLLNVCSMAEVNGKPVPLTDELRRNINSMNSDMASNALRVLGAAYKDESARIPKDDFERNLVFKGLVGMIDPPREEAKAAVELCKRAGIKAVMITGDHVLTATAIAKQLGILCAGDKSVSGAELDKMDKRELEKNIFSYSVFARVSPEHKVRIVRAFQARGAVAAMTGDGVNDAPALKIADIGCAMGISGTDVAKGAADMVLTDDNFATIVEAVRHGRGIYANIKKAAHFLLSSNTGEILTIFAAFLMGLPSPLLPIQLLWVNLVTDSFPALALGAEKADDDIMEQPPISPKKSLFADGLALAIITEGLMIGSLALLAFSIGRAFFGVGGDVSVARTMAFSVLSLSQLVHAFNARSGKSVFKIGLTSNSKMTWSFALCLVMQLAVVMVPPFAAIFKVVPLNIPQWLTVAALSLMPLPLIELQKSVTNRDRRRDAVPTRA
ncbi:MAG: calcium-translocating P-type ATPase, PMCA-type [Oscillospiraceae bacterium]|jgi:Ca2+-transporting ATPase|nr:calcium-translocating P-type ATPase, PMCA-type [Oscillospiraceae bacterium]